MTESRTLPAAQDLEQSRFLDSGLRRDDTEPLRQLTGDQQQSEWDCSSHLGTVGALAGETRRRRKVDSNPRSPRLRNV